MMKLIVYLSVLLPILFLQERGLIRDVLLYLHAFCIPFIITSSSSNDLYGLKHFIFNLELPPRTLWFNMGFWESPNATFPEACAHLVKTVIKNMNLNRESNVLDVGFGCGDSCILIAEQYGCNVTGITNELSQWQIATSRVTSNGNIQLLHGSADHLATVVGTDQKYTHVISIDSAYHYNTRSSFFKQVHDQHLQAGGALGLFDLVIAKEYKHRMMVDVFCRLLHIPRANVVTIDEYHDQLVEAGFDQVEVQALERAQVFGGLARYLEKTRDEFGDELSMGNRVFLKITGWMFTKLSARPWIVPVLVQANKSTSLCVTGDSV